MKWKAVLFTMGVFATPVSAFDDNAIKQMCAEEWGNDYSMVAYCRDQQRGAAKKFDTYLEKAKLNSVLQTIVGDCVAEWNKDYSMLVYCTNQQLEAFSSLQSLPDDVPQGVITTIKSDCEVEWGSDFRMVEYCIEQQTEAWRSLQ
ncbi:MAG: hypothetical protein GW948_01535 [Rhodobacterales bacterium]|nr:hypothetical protein [Rhodobacterales bacterium]